MPAIFLGKKKLGDARLFRGIHCFTGLMFHAPLGSREMVILCCRATAIHTFFVFFPIDVCWLDEEKRVVHMARNIQPFTASVRCPSGQRVAYIVESSSASRLLVDIRVGQRFSFDAS